MPLQKPPPQGTQTPDAQSTQRRLLQERRRTLQTISELSVTDEAPESNPFIKKEHTGRVSFATDPTPKRKTPSFNKRRSLPQYCSNPNCVHGEASARRSQPNHSTPATDAHRYEEGWNARRERTRAQREQALAGTTNQRQASGHRFRVASQTILPVTIPRSSSQDYLKSYASHHQLLRNSRSISGFPLTSAQRSSFGGSTGHSSHRDYDTESSERASTDSSSYHSVHESAIRRSRSGSSTQSFNMQVAPPAQNTFPPTAQRYYSNPAHFYNGVTMGQISTSTTGRPVPTTRSISLPIIRVQDANGTSRNDRRSHRTSIQQPKQYIDIQTARLETLAALTSPRHDSSTTSRTSPPTTANTQLPHTSPSSPPNRNSYAQRRSHLRSSLQVPLPAYQSSNPSNNIISAQKPGEQGLLILPPPTNSFEQRIVPKRESLTQWKAEREGAKARFEGMRRADTRERVRRANELEEEKEKELLMMGKGTVVMVEKEKVNDKGKVRGCLGGLFALFPWRRRRGDV